MAHSLGFLALVVGGAVVGGGTAALVLSPETPAPAMRSSVDAVLLAQVEDLVRENEALRDRVGALEAMPQAELRVPTDVVRGSEEIEALREEVQMLQAAMENRPGTQMPLRTDVEHALEAIRSDERLEREQVMQAKREVRAEKQLTRLATDLQLSPQQTDQVREAFARRDARVREMEQVWADTRDLQLVGEMKQTNRDEHRTELEQILTPEQFEAYQEREARPKGG